MSTIVKNKSADPFSEQFTTLPNNRDTWRVFPSALTEYELEAIQAHADQLNINRGEVFGDQDASLKKSQGRISDVGWLTANNEVENIIWNMSAKQIRHFKLML